MQRIVQGRLMECFCSNCKHFREEADQTVVSGVCREGPPATIAPIIIANNLSELKPEDLKSLVSNGYVSAFPKVKGDWYCGKHSYYRFVESEKQPPVQTPNAYYGGTK